MTIFSSHSLRNVWNQWKSVDTGHLSCRSKDQCFDGSLQAYLLTPSLSNFRSHTPKISIFPRREQREAVCGLCQQLCPQLPMAMALLSVFEKLKLTLLQIGQFTSTQISGKPLSDQIVTVSSPYDNGPSALDKAILNHVTGQGFPNFSQLSPFWTPRGAGLLGGRGLHLHGQKMCPIFPPHGPYLIGTRFHYTFLQHSIYHGKT